MTTPGFAGLWTSLPTSLTPWVLDVIQSLGYSQMTPVQAATIPLFMKHKDVVVEAVTGSGKTLAFVVPIIEKLIRRETPHRKNEVGALIITPTRELATQIHSVISLFIASQPSTGAEDKPNRAIPPPLVLVSSRESTPAQDIQTFLLTGADIVIGTPGRVEEFLLGKGRDIVNVKELEILVLDEADRLLDLGFQVATTRIITHLPKQRRTGLFSATMTDADALSELVRVGLRNPARVVVKVQSKKVGKNRGAPGLIEERRIPANLQNYYINCKASEKFAQLVRILKYQVEHEKSSHFIMYFSTCACVDYFYRILPLTLSPSTKLFSLHGNLTPSTRTKTLNSFSTSVADTSAPCILLATDVAARGLDIPNVDVVIQFDPPTDTKAFSHRCGRTARAGRSGRAWTLLSDKESGYVDLLQVRKIPVIRKPNFIADAAGTITPAPAITSQREEEDMDVEETSKEDPEVEVLLTKIRTFLLKDRVYHDLAVKAFVSFVKAYSKHEASYIFRIKDLDLVGVAKSFGLLRLPGMFELKDTPKGNWKDAEVDWVTYAYRDQAQEGKRLIAITTERAKNQAIAAERAKERSRKKKVNAAWSENVERQVERAKRKEKKVAKIKWLRKNAREEPSVDGTTSKRARDGVDDDDDGGDWDELAREERMAKKVKKGEIFQRVFDAEFGDL